MRWVQHAAIRPHHCAVIPYVANSNARAGFFDTGNDFRDQDHCYISVEAVQEMARLIGWQPSTVLKPLEAKVAARDERIAELEAEVAEHEKFRDAAEYTLEKFGSKVRNKPGRKVAA